MLTCSLKHTGGKDITPKAEIILPQSICLNKSKKHSVNVGDYGVGYWAIGVGVGTEWVVGAESIRMQNEDICLAVRKDIADEQRFKRDLKEEREE